MTNWISFLYGLEKKASDKSYFPDASDLAPFCEFTETEYTQAALLAAFVLHNNRRKSVTLNVLFERLADREDHIALQQAFVELVTSGYIEIKGDDASEDDPEIEISQSVNVALRTDQKIHLHHQKAQIKPEEKELLNLYAYALLFLSRNMAYTTWLFHCRSFIRKSTIPLAKKLKRLKSDEQVKAAGLFACILSLMGWRNIQIRWLSNLFASNRLRAQLLNEQWKAENSVLLETGLLRLEQCNFGRIILVADFRIMGSIESSTKAKVNSEAIILPSTLQITQASAIERRILLYNSENRSTTDELFRLLQPAAFTSYTSKMKKQSNFSGITILLSGLPGTGKTELARQLARETGRELLMFNVAEQRDRYYGESEKKIKQLFEYYKVKAASPKSAPILCFNEADSIFQKRSEHHSNSSQTENAVQTILLNELEVFTGILICTTNLPEMFDAAFARRFLYRIDIGMPDAETRMLLLQDFFPQLKEEDRIKLASNFNFSAANLLNFKRKQEIARIIRKRQTTMLIELENYLMAEIQKNNESNRQIVGFKPAQMKTPTPLIHSLAS